MNKLIAELQRLYFLPEQQGQRAGSTDALTSALMCQALQGQLEVGLKLVSELGLVRVMGIAFRRASDWPAVASLIQAIQDELDLPVPAVSVSGQAGFSLWFSLDGPLPVAEARSFLAALKQKYLGAIPAHQLEMFPAEGLAMALVPGLHPETGRWSAFIDPTMGAMFVDESGLEMAPNMDRQADILAGFKCMKTADFRRAGEQLAEVASLPAVLPHGETAEEGGAAANAVSRSTFNPGQKYEHPVSFLLAVMNEPSVSIADRIEAAKALLPHFPVGRPE